jgi:hypothetical protein
MTEVLDDNEDLDKKQFLREAINAFRQTIESEDKKKHVFLYTRDRWQSNFSKFEDSIVLNYGPKLKDAPREIVVPENGIFIKILY